MVTNIQLIQVSTLPTVSTS